MSSCASTPNDGGQVAAGSSAATVRYVVPPVSFRSVVPLLDSMVGAGGKSGRARAGRREAAGTLMNRECAFTCVTTKFGSAAGERQIGEASPAPAVAARRGAAGGL